jgi:PAS domain S-box-containing protein
VKDQKTLLLVEDDGLLAMTEIRWLNKAGYKVIHVINGEKAVEIVQKCKDQIDLILMDINLGSGIDGTQAAQEILRDHDIPLLFLSSHTEHEIVEKTERISSYGYVVKNSNDVVLLVSIKMAFKLHDANKELKSKEKALSENQARLRISEFISKAGNGALHEPMNLKQIEERLLKLQIGIDCSEDAIFITDKDGKIEFTNHAFETIYGFSPEEIIGKTPRIIKSNLIPQTVYENFWSTLLSKNSVNGEIQNKTKDGQLITIEGSNNPILDHSGEIIGFLGIHRDVTKRKRAEDLLRESEERFRLIVGNNPDLTMVQDKNGFVTFLSHQALSVIGHDPEKFMGQTFPDYIHPEDCERAFKTMMDALTGKEIIDFEYRFFGEKGELHWLSHTVRPLITDGELKSVFSTVRDITERKNDEIKLRESEERFRVIFENNSAAMAIIEPDTTISMVNDAYCQLSGYNKQEIRGMSWTKQIPPDDLERLKEYNRRRFLNPNDAPDKYEFKFYNKNGEIKHGLMSFSLTTGSQKIIASFTDITERKHAEETLRESELQYKTLFEHANDAIIIFEPEEEIILEANHRACTTYGFSRSEFIGMSLKALSKNVGAGEKHLQKLLMQGTYEEFETEQFRKDGTAIHLLVNSSIIDYKGKKAVLSINRDITERKQIFEESIYNHSLLEATIESTADGILVVDRNGKISKANKKFADLWNIPASLIDSGDDNNLIMYILDQLKDPDAFIKKVEELYANPGLQSYDTFEFKDGRTFERLSIPQRLGEEIIGRVWNFRDITERKRIKKVLEESEKKYKDLFEKSEDANLIIINGRFVDCNEATVKMLRYNNKKELLDTHPSELSPEMQPDGKTSFEKANEMMSIALEKGSNRFEWNHKKADGEVFLVEVLLTAIDINGENKILHTVWRDITERKKSERLREALYEISEATFVATDMDSLYKRIHEVISTLITAKNFYIAIYDEKLQQISFPYFVDEYDPPQPTKKIGKGLTEYVLRNGKAMLVDSKLDMQLREAGEVELIGSPQAIWLGVPLNVNGKTIGVIVVQDYENENAYDEKAKQLLTYIAEQVAQVIERKRGSDEIKKISDELLHLNQTKDKFFTIISHDLKNPFQSINSALKLMLNEDESLTEEEKNNFLHGILNTSTKAYSLLENLLIWSKHQMGKMDFNPERFELSEEIIISIDLLKNSASLKNITLTNKIDRGIYVIADRNMLDTVIRNLVTNAIKFTRENGSVEIGSKINYDNVEVTVTDNGIGIPAESLSKLFRIDQSISTQGTKNETGTGLGLILCKEFVEKNRGRIHVESDPGIGTRIIFTLPTDL